LENKFIYSKLEQNKVSYSHKLDLLHEIGHSTHYHTGKIVNFIYMELCMVS
jgi:hypothetical protein